MVTTIDIDHRALAKLASEQAMRDTVAVGQPGGWCVEVELNGSRGRLVSKRGGPRLFSRFETLAGYLRRVGIDHFSVEAEHFTPTSSRSRPDAAERMTRTHDAAEHDAWFRHQVEQALREADCPDAQWTENAPAMSRIRDRIKGQQSRRQGQDDR